MSKPAEKTEPKVTQSEEPTKGELNSPEIGKNGRPTKRVITNPKQAHAYAKRLYDRAKDGRIKTASVIRDKYDGGPPFDPAYLRRVGQTWRNNFSTNYLGSVIDRTSPQLKDPANKADLLYHCSLPTKVIDGAQKSRAFNEIMTRTVRAWPKWKTLVGRSAQEDITYGNAVITKIGEDWRPVVWRFDQAFLPDGTGQHASEAQSVVLRERMPLHDFIQLFADNPEAADKAGYDLEGCRKAANSAKGTLQKSEGDTNDLEKQDQKREDNREDSFDGGSTTVCLFHIVVRDYTGEVDLWTVTEDDGTLVRSVEGLHQNMEECLALLTMQEGNEKFYGSKGLGRYLTNIHIAVERSRNMAFDLLHLSGMRIAQAEGKDIPEITMKMRFPLLIVKSGVKIISEQFEFNHEAFAAMDKMLTQIGDSIAGAFIPTDIDQSGSAHTKIEAAQNAQRELAVREGVLGRFFDQLSHVLDIMKGGICSSLNMREAYRRYQARKAAEDKGLKVILRKAWEKLKEFMSAEEIGGQPEEEVQIADEEAVAALVEMFEAGLSPEEIAILSLSPANFNSEDEGVDKDNRTLNYIAQNKANPYVDQRKASEMEANIAVGPDRAKQLIIPEDDPNVKAKARRDQIMEFADMLEGFEIPVVLTDNHKIHRETLLEQLNLLIPGLPASPTAELIKAAQLAINHYAEHLAHDTFTSEDTKKEEEEMLRGMMQQVEQVKGVLAEQEQANAELAAQNGITPPGGANAPAPVEGQPALANGNGDTQLDGIKAAADIKGASKKLELEERKVALEERKQDHTELKDTVQMELSAAEQTERLAAQQRAEETQKANEDLAAQTGNPALR